MSWTDDPGMVREEIRLLAVAVARNKLVQRHPIQYRRLLKRHSKLLVEWDQLHSGDVPKDV